MLHRIVLAQPFGEHFGSHALRGDEFAVDAAVRVAQPGHRRVGLEEAIEPLVAGRGVQLGGSLAQHQILHQQVQRLALGLRGVEELHVHARHLLAHAFDLALVGGLPLGARDAAVAHLGGVGHRFVGEARVALDAEEHEGRNDQQHDEPEHQPGVVANEIEHVARALRKALGTRLAVVEGTKRAPRAAANEEGEPRFALLGLRPVGRRLGADSSGAAAGPAAQGGGC